MTSAPARGASPTAADPRRPSMERVRVEGRGIVGMTLALSLARLGIEVEWGRGTASAAPAREDVRTYALNPASVRLLGELRVWEALPADAVSAVRDMRIAGDRPGSSLEFTAWQQCVGELAWIVDAAALESTLQQAIAFAPRVVPDDGQASRAAALTVHCEGRDSAARSALGVAWNRHDYGQRAVAARLHSDRPHQGTAWQWFRCPDVLALLPFERPLAHRSFGLVWSLPAAQAAQLGALDAAAFEQELEAATGGAAGRLRLASERVTWPLAIAEAERWCGPGWALAGDAAHVVHPLAGQGLNLGLADVAELSGVLARREPWRSLGDERLLRRYERARRGPTRAMGRVTDGLLQLFAVPSEPVRALRNRGLDVVNHLGEVKRWLAARALNG